jgi:adenylate cyclase
MAQVFVSYARADEAQAEKVEQALRSAGYEVWRDAELPAHRSYAEVIEERLKAADAVVVLWSGEAAKSQWVRAEADTARAAGTLVQVTTDGSLPPIPFNQIQCADLQGWNGDERHQGWRKLHTSVAALAGQRAEQEEPAPQRRTRCSVCVLPFANMSGDPEQEYFSDGISEDITTDLSKVSALEVIARNTAFTFKGQSVDVAEIARKLRVSHVLEGSVRKAGNRVRITAQLIDGRTGGHIWADRYDRDLTDIFAIQDEISNAIVEALKVKLLPEEKEAIGDRCTCNADAYSLYLKARGIWVSGNHGDRRREQRVIELCERAVQIDPDYAFAWALLSIAQSNLHFGFGDPCDDGVAAAEKALSLDPARAEAFCAKSRVAREAGHFDEALEHLQVGLRLDPESFDLHKAAANLLQSRGRVAEALTHFEKAAELVDSDYHAWGMAYSCHRALGQKEQALAAARKTLEESERVLADDPVNGAAISFAVTALAALGETERAKAWMQRALLIDPDNLNMRYNFACTLASEMGDREGALAMLERSMKESKGSIGNAEFDPDLESLHDDPRFKAMIAKAKERLVKFRK